MGAYDLAMPGNEIANSPIPPCPMCGYDLSATVAAGLHTCPECGWTFSDEEIALLGPSNPEGAPRSLRPQERRIGGPALLIILAIVTILLVALALYLTRL